MNHDLHITGHCHCGLIAYRAVIDPSDVSICHCTDCQRLTGSAYRVTAIAQKQNFHMTRGKPRLYVKRGDNGKKRLQYFCGDCGSPIFTTGEGHEARVIGIRVGTIDQRQTLVPTRQTWCASRLAWTAHLDGITALDGE